MSTSKTALILGVSGQDGAYLARLLLRKGYRVVGGSRDAQSARARGSSLGLNRLGIEPQIEWATVSLVDFRSVLACLEKFKPDEIYHLSGQSSVFLSHQQPVETFESITVATLNLLEAVRITRLPTRIYHACSSECFGEAEMPCDERTPFHPRSPYAVAKSAAFWIVSNYREAYRLHASSGILFNHESPLRADRFVTQKIVQAATRISKGSKEKLELGNLDVKRDWGWAPEFVEGMWKMLQLDAPTDFVLATGVLHPLRDFLDRAFRSVELDWKEHVVIKHELLRPLDLKSVVGNASKAKRELGWEARTGFDEIVRGMMDAALGRKLE